MSQKNVLRYPSDQEYVPKYRQQEHLDNLQEPYFFRIEGAQRNIDRSIQNLYESVVILDRSMREQRAYNTIRTIADVALIIAVLFLMIGPKIFKF